MARLSDVLPGTLIGRFRSSVVALFSVPRPYHGPGCRSLVFSLFATPSRLTAARDALMRRRRYPYRDKVPSKSELPHQQAATPFCHEPPAATSFSKYLFFKSFFYSSFFNTFFFVSFFLILFFPSSSL